MRRFDDLLRMLSSILLGLLIKDAPTLSKKLHEYLENCGGSPGACKNLAHVVAVVIIVGFFRSIHGSSRYDDVRESTSADLRPRYEKYLSGRVFGFVATLATLIVAPLCALMLQWEALPDGSSSLFLFTLSLPYLVYCIYDLVLVASLHVDSPIRYPAIAWLKLHTSLGVAFLVLVLHFLQAGSAFPPEMTAVVFIVAASIQIGGDYVLNRHFYFPE